MRVLTRNNITPTIVTGTSIGSVVGAAYLAGKLDDLEQWALDLNRVNVLSYFDFRIRSAGMIGGRRLRKDLEENFKDMVIEDLPHPFVAIAADLVTGHEIWIQEGSIIDSMLASFALPGVFPPIKQNHRLLADGALVNPVPVSPLQPLGARMTIAVDLNTDIVGKAAQAERQGYNNVTGFDMFDDADVPPEKQKEISSGMTKRLFKREGDNPSMFGVMMTALGIMNDRLTRSRMAGDPPDIHIKPLIGHIGMMEFEKAEELIALGEEAAEKALPDIFNAMKVYLPPE